MFVDKIDRSKISLANFFDRLKKVMKSSLVENSSKMISPALQYFRIFFNLKGDALPESLELEVDDLPDAILLFGLISDQFEDEVKMEVDLELFVLIVVLSLRNAYFEFDEDKLVVEIGLDWLFLMICI